VSSLRNNLAWSALARPCHGLLPALPRLIHMTWRACLIAEGRRALVALDRSAMTEKRVRTTEILSGIDGVSLSVWLGGVKGRRRKEVSLLRKQPCSDVDNSEDSVVSRYIKATYIEKVSRRNSLLPVQIHRGLSITESFGGQKAARPLQSAHSRLGNSSGFQLKRTGFPHGDSTCPKPGKPSSRTTLTGQKSPGETQT